MTTLVPLCLGWMSNDADMFVPGEAGTIRYPVPGYAVVHEQGTVLFDTGLHESLITSDEMLGVLAPMFTVELTAADLPEARLAEAGIDPASVTHVVNSHLHFDHCGHNGPFADAVTLVQVAEWEAARKPATPYSYVGVPLDEIGAGDLRLVDGEIDLFGDGTVVLVPTPGHTVGHQSLLVRAGPEPDADGGAARRRRLLPAAHAGRGHHTEVRDRRPRSTGVVPQPPAPRGGRRAADLLPRHRRVGRRAGRAATGVRRLTSPPGSPRSRPRFFAGRSAMAASVQHIVIWEDLAMAWDFCTDPDVQARLDWADRFVAEEIEPVESLLYDVVDVGRPEGAIAELFEQWRQEVKDQQLYAAHLPVEQGGQGFGEVNLALLNEVIGRSYWAPHVFATGPGTPGSGQSDVLAVFGTDQQKQRWLYPLLEGKITMIYSMTEPHGGADPTGFRCQAVRDGDEWVINGDKFFSSGAEQAELILLMAVTDPDASAYQGMSMFIVPTNAPGVRIFGELGGRDDDDEEYRGVGFGHHPYIRYQDVRVPADHLIGDQGKAFEMAQRRLSAGRMHHAMRAVALAKREFEMICERALSRYTQGGLLAEKQMVQEMVADAWLELTQFRLLILQAAWVIERDGYGAARRYVAACKVKAAEIQREMAYKATHIHGALGTTNTLPITRATDWLGIADGPTEVHKVSLARQVLRDYQPSQDLWPTRFRPRTLLKARARLDEIAAARLPDGAHAELHELLQTSTNGNDAAIARMTEFMHMTTEEGLYADFDPAARLFPPSRR